MIYTFADLKALFQVTNVQAMSRVVRERESSQRDDAYTIINGGGHFTPPLTYSEWRHPWHGIPTTQGARACGAYQHLGTTWAGLATKYGIPDFSPPSQDAGFVGGLIERGALDDVMAGRFEQAVAKLRKEWTSLPGAAESSDSWTMDKALAVFKKYGGGAADQVVVPAPAPTPEPTRSSTTMDPVSILMMFGSALKVLVPQIAGILAPKTEVGQRNVQLAQLAPVLVDTIVGAAGASNMQQAVEKMQDPVAGPEIQKAVQQAVVTEPKIMAALQIVEVGGGAKAAAERDIVVMQQDKPFWKSSAVFWVSVLLMPMVYWLVGSLIMGGMAAKMMSMAQGLNTTVPSWLLLVLSVMGDAWEGETRSGGFNLVVGLVLGGICGVYFGVSVTQARQAAQQQADKSAQP